MTRESAQLKAFRRKVSAALKMAAQDAWGLAKKTGIGFHVWQDGKIVNLNPPGNSLPKDRPLPVRKETKAQREAYRRELIATTKRRVEAEIKRLKEKGLPCMVRENGRRVDLTDPKPPKKQRRRKA